MAVRRLLNLGPNYWIGLFGIALALLSAGTWAVAPFHVSSAELGADLTTHYQSQRGLLLVFGFATALGNALHAVFFAGLRTIVAADSLAQWLARIGLVCLLIEVVVVTVAFAIFTAVAYAQPPAGVAAAFTDLGWILINQSAGPVTAIGLVAMTVALRRSHLVRGWAAVYTAFVGAAHLVVAAALANEGPLSPAGTVAFVVPMLFFSWFAAIGAELMRRAASDQGAVERALTADVRT